MTRAAPSDHEKAHKKRKLRLDRARSVLLPLYFMITSKELIAVYIARPDQLFGDARIYFRATQAWLDGTNPWIVENAAIRFGAPPPALLLNLPLVPLGEHVAVVAWMLASAAAVLWILRKFGLPFWWAFFYPLAEGLSGGTTDFVLAALVLVGWGWLGVLTKPYSLPALLAERRWAAVLLAGVAAVVTVPFLPWAEFFASTELIRGAFANQAYPNSAWGMTWLMVPTALALVTLGWRRGLSLLTPALLAQQPHYAIFSLSTIAQSKLLILGLAWPVRGSAAMGTLLYALVDGLRRRRRFHERRRSDAAVSQAVGCSDLR